MQDPTRPLDIAVIGITAEIAIQALKNLAEANMGQVERRMRDRVILKDGTKIVAIPARRVRKGLLDGCRFDQLILTEGMEAFIQNLTTDEDQRLWATLSCSRIPHQHRIQRLE